MNTLNSASIIFRSDLDMGLTENPDTVSGLGDIAYCTKVRGRCQRGPWELHVKTTRRKTPCTDHALSRHLQCLISFLSLDHDSPKATTLTPHRCLVRLWLVSGPRSEYSSPPRSALAGSGYNMPSDAPETQLALPLVPETCQSEGGSVGFGKHREDWASLVATPSLTLIALYQRVPAFGRPPGLLLERHGGRVDLG
jgi:hypothetical protein